MSLDTIKMFFQNERNKLIGIGAATCLVTTAIVAPSAYFGGQPKYDDIKPVAFNTISATGEHLADYGDLDVPAGQDGWGNEDNISYVTTDRDLTANVIDTKNGIGFQALNVAEKEAEEMTKSSESLNIMSAEFDDVGGVEGKTEYVDPLGDDKKNYELVAPINIYMRVPAPVSIFFKDNLMSEANDTNTPPTIWDADWTRGEAQDGKVAGVHKDAGNLKNLNNGPALKGYYGWVEEGQHLADLLMGYTFFNWMLFNPYDDKDGIGNYPVAPKGTENPTLNSTTNETEEELGDLFANNVDQMLTNIVENGSVTNDEYKKANVIAISGTGTVDPYIQEELSTFNNFLMNEEYLDENGTENPNYHSESSIDSLKKVDNTDVSPNLTNQGSSTAWFMPGGDGIEFSAGDGNDWSLKQDTGVGATVPSNNAFIGTQSRRSYYGFYSDSDGNDSISGMSQWGYGYQPTNPDEDEWNYMEQPTSDDISGMQKDVTFGKQDADESKPYANEIPWNYETEISNTDMALPLGFTVTTDPLVFFTDSDTTFKHNGENYKPTGMTPEGTKLIFQNPLQYPNITWDLLYLAGAIDAAPIN